MSNDKELKKLQSQWYAKLKRDGFEDIEWTKGHSLNGTDSPYLKDSAFNYKKKYNESTAQYYRLMQNYCTNAKKITKKNRFILQNYCDGLTFRQILTKCRVKGGWYAYDNEGNKNLSLFSLHHLLKRLIKEAYEWNKTSPEGLLLPELDDSNV